MQAPARNHENTLFQRGQRPFKKRFESDSPFSAQISLYIKFYLIEFYTDKFVCVTKAVNVLIAKRYINGDDDDDDDSFYRERNITSCKKSCNRYI